MIDNRTPEFGEYFTPRTTISPRTELTIRKYHPMSEVTRRLFRANTGEANQGSAGLAVTLR
jgi:hypothetical protein